MQHLAVKFLHVLSAATLLLTAAIAGCAAPLSDEVLEPTGVKGGSGSGGGSVKDTDPQFDAFSGSLDEATNSGLDTEVFVGAVFDANGENDLKDVTVTIDLTGPTNSTSNHTVTKDEIKVTAEPASFGADGFKVWDGTKNDGVLHVAFQYTYARASPPGTYTFTPSITPSGGETATGPVDNTTVTVFSEVTIDPTPVLGDGTPDIGGTWGGWEADPGARNVSATNYLKLVNTGLLPNAAVVVDFTDDAFIGVDDQNFTIPIAGNIQFAWWEDATPNKTTPAQGNFTFLSTDANGSTTIQFTGLDNVVYVTYRIVRMPDVLPVQDYTAAFTATEI